MQQLISHFFQPQRFKFENCYGATDYLSNPVFFNRALNRGFKRRLSNKGSVLLIHRLSSGRTSPKVSGGTLSNLMIQLSVLVVLLVESVAVTYQLCVPGVSVISLVDVTEGGILSIKSWPFRYKRYIIRPVPESEEASHEKVGVDWDVQ